jgi:hypothetical protein
MVPEGVDTLGEAASGCSAQTLVVQMIGITPPRYAAHEPTAACLTSNLESVVSSVVSHGHGRSGAGASIAQSVNANPYGCRTDTVAVYVMPPRGIGDFRVRTRCHFSRPGVRPTHRGARR